MLTRFLDPKNDFAFKRIFGTQKNEDILITLLNEVLRNQLHRKIEKVCFLPTIQEPEIFAKKQSIVDVLVEDKDGCQYIIEMQVARTGGFEERAQYYAAKAYVNQLQKGEEYEKLKEVIFLSFTNFAVFPKKEHYKSEHITLDKKTLEHDLDKISFTFVDLVKFEQQRNQDIAELSLEEKFYYFLKHAQDLSNEALKKLITNAQIIEKALNELSRSSWSNEEFHQYEQVEKINRDNAAAAKFALKEARQQGEEQGITIGKERALEQTALAMHRAGLDIELIARVTQLPKKTLETLFKQAEK